MCIIQGNTSDSDKSGRELYFITLYQVGPSSLMCALYCGHVEVAMMFLLEQGSTLR